MDKSWMTKQRLSIEYKNGLNQFLDMAFDRSNLNGKILCPCKFCKNGKWLHREEAKDHLIVDGFMKGYTNWMAHGEKITNNMDNGIHDEQYNNFTNMYDLVHEAFGVKNPPNEVGDDDLNGTGDEPNDQAKTFYELLDDAQQELYPGCERISKLEFIVRLFHLKCMGKWSNKSFTMLLELLREAFPLQTQSLPKSYYGVRKSIGALGLSCIKINACPNDCMLYWKEHENDSICHVCGTSRYVGPDSNSNDEEDTSVKSKSIPAKVLRYFPLKPRLQRLFMSCKTASFMRWHKEERTKDGYMRHPGDSPAWIDFDRRFRDFSNEPRNVRLGLAANGFSPFRTMSVAHSTWPVILTPYNLPPWMCMTESYFFLTLLILGPSSPGNNIDVEESSADVVV